MIGRSQLELWDFRFIAGQATGFAALVICIMAFASKRDDRLLLLLVFANVAFAVQFFLFGAKVAGAISALIILRILLARRYKGSWPVMAAMLAATGLVSWISWERPLDVIPLTAGLLGTIAMFMLDGIPMRLLLAGAALCWVASNVLVGSVGAALAELLVLTTNAITIWRLTRDRREALA